MELHTIGIDLGKTVFHLVGLNQRGEVVVRKKFSRKQLLHVTANLQVELIGMETCGRSHFPGRALREQGHEVRLMPAQYVKPHVKTNKSDYIDAEAVGRPKMRFGPISPWFAGNASRRQPIVGSRTSFWGPNPVSKCEAGLSGTWQG